MAELNGNLQAQNGGQGGQGAAQGGQGAQAGQQEAGQAAQGAQGGQGAAQGGQGTQAGQEPGQATFTLAEVQKLIQSETDKRVTQALKKQQAEFDRRAQLSGLNDSERAIAERDDTIRALNERLSELNAYKAKNAVLTQLADAGLPAAFAELITIDADPESAEVNQARVTALQTAFRQAVEAGVKARLSGTRTPQTGGAAPAMTREEYLKLTLSEKAALAQSDPELYRRMNE